METNTDGSFVNIPPNTGQTTSLGLNTCRWCGLIHQEMCSRIKEIEYHLDGITIKRVVFY